MRGRTLDYVRPLESETGVKLQRREIPVDYDVVRGVDTVVVNRIYQNVGTGTHAGVEVVFSHDVKADGHRGHELPVLTSRSAEAARV